MKLFLPVFELTTNILIPCGILNGLASFFLTEFLTKSLNIGIAVLAPVSYFPNDDGSSYPT